MFRWVWKVVYFAKFWSQFITKNIVVGMEKGILQFCIHNPV